MKDAGTIGGCNQGRLPSLQKVAWEVLFVRSGLGKAWIPMKSHFVIWREGNGKRFNERILYVQFA
jgi:hypothetical protein